MIGPIFQTSYLLTLWILGAFGIVALAAGIRRLSAIMLAVILFVITGWAYFCNQASGFLITQVTAQQAYLNVASMLLLLVPPLFYHMVCLVMRKSWTLRISVLAIYVLNLFFVGLVNYRHAPKSDEVFAIHFWFSQVFLSDFYRTLFFATFITAMIRMVQFHVEMNGRLRFKIQYLMLSIIVLVVGFLGTPGFSNLLFGSDPVPTALLAFPLFGFITTYAIVSNATVNIQRGLLKFGIFSAVVASFVWAFMTLMIALPNYVGRLDLIHPYLDQILTAAFLIGFYGISYRLIINLSAKISKKQNEKVQNTVLQIAAKSAAEKNVGEAIRISMDFLRDHFQIEELALLVKDENGEVYSVKYCHGVDFYRLKGFEVNKSLIKWLGDKRRSFVLSEELQNMSPSAYYEHTNTITDLKLEVCHPLFIKDVLTGALLLGFKNRTRIYTAQDLNLISIVSTILASIIENQRLLGQAVTDGLTGLFHQKYFKARLSEALERSNHNKSELALILLDIDHFKKLNDTQGHLAGDKVLQGISKTLQETVRSNDILARYGGEEFGVFIYRPYATASGAPVEKHDLLTAAERLAEKMRVNVKGRKILYNDRILNATISVGIGFKDPGETNITVQEIIERADQALYHAKRHGRDRVAIATRFGIRIEEPSIEPPPNTDLPGPGL